MAQGLKKCFITALTDTAVKDREGVGTIRFEGNQVYKWVQYTGVTPVTPGTVVCQPVGIDTYWTADGANSVLGIGVAMGTQAVGAVSYGWAQIKGVATLLNPIGLNGQPSSNGASVVVTGGPANGAVQMLSGTGNGKPCGSTVDIANKVINCDFPF